MRKVYNKSGLSGMKSEQFVSQNSGLFIITSRD